MRCERVTLPVMRVGLQVTVRLRPFPDLRVVEGTCAFRGPVAHMRITRFVEDRTGHSRCWRKLRISGRKPGLWDEYWSPEVPWKLLKRS